MKLILRLKIRKELWPTLKLSSVPNFTIRRNKLARLAGKKHFTLVYSLWVRPNMGGWGVTCKGYYSIRLTYMRYGEKILPVQNTLAYYTNVKWATKKIFNVVSGGQCYKTFCP
jgi:hypothetical protein